MQQTTKDNLANRNIWARGLYMLFYVIAYAVAETIAWLIVLFQFIHALFTGRVNEPLQIFGARLATYLYQVLQYVTFNSEFQPFPFSDWPDVEAGATPWSVTAAKRNSDGPAAQEQHEQTLSEQDPDDSPQTDDELDLKDELDKK